MGRITSKTELSQLAKTANAVRGVARVWSILVFLLALILMVGSHSGTGSLTPQSGPYDFLIPLALLVSLIGLGVAWRWEGWGALINIVFYLSVVPLYGLLQGKWIHFSIMVGLSPVILPGVLFAIACLLDRKAASSA